MDIAKAVKLERGPARSWLESSLAQGFDVSAAVRAAAPFDGGSFQSFVSDGEVPHTNFAEGGTVDARGTQAGLAHYLNGLSSDGAACVVVEDDLALRTDPAASGRRHIPSAFLGDRVVHWCNLEPGTGMDCADVINRSASGYPLNAFVSTKSAADLGLANGQAVAEDLASETVASLLAIVVSAFDAESFLVWDRG